MPQTLTIADLPELPAVVIRISREWREGLSEAQLYERVRRYWKIQPEKRLRPPVLAYGVAEGVIQAVYWIDGWETYDMAMEPKAPDRVDQSAHMPGQRLGFVGRPAPEYAHLLGQVLADAPRGQNPVTYVRCTV